MSVKIKNIVNKILRHANIKSLPVNLNDIIVLYDITLRYAFFEDSISGLLYKKDNKNIISVNTSHPLVRQRFTIAHELGHFFLNHHGSLFVDKGYIYRDKRSSTGTIKWEREANEFAAELLMPEKLLVNYIKKENLEDISDLDKIAQELQVSSQALTYRLMNLDLVPLY